MLAQQALERFTDLRQPRGIAHASRVRGLVALARRQDVTASDMFNCALSLAREHGLELLQAETLLALAVIAQRRGSAPDRFRLVEQAQNIFKAINAEAWGEQVARRMQQF